MNTLFMEACYATILVLVVTRQQLILAADSRKTHLNPDGIGEKATIDKIYQTRDYYYAVSGFHASAGNHFSIQAVLHKILLKAPDFDKAVQQIAVELATALKKYFTHLRDSSAALFRQYQKYTGSGGEIFIVKRMDHIPAAYLLDYRVVEAPEIKVVLHTGKIDTRKIEGEHCFWRAIGNTGFLDPRLTEMEMVQNPIATVKRILQEGIRRYPDFVGAPINLLQLTASGERWIEKSATAPNRIH